MGITVLDSYCENKKRAKTPIVITIDVFGVVKLDNNRRMTRGMLIRRHGWNT